MRTYEAIEVNPDSGESYLTILLINVLGKPSGEQVGRFETYDQLFVYAKSKGWLDGDDIGCWCQNCMGAGEMTH
ncbi:MAG: hypothetical protein DCF25_11865 [Leptolyngbya foveolarum]|uniref:Uncharacterized protein n=1 Tax=Leptolyngbya foveolarum TaxID=47253 RepID=A0A2W4U9Q4_9CYAN|nr:MAG: hypothetical protein DCF25_11865 [Leptolyngbya foveolarum]